MSSRRPACGPASVDLAGERDRTSRGARRAPFAKTDLRAVAELAGVSSSAFSLTWGHPHWACTTRSHGTAVLSQTDAAFQRRRKAAGTVRRCSGCANGSPYRGRPAARNVCLAKAARCAAGRKRARSKIAFAATHPDFGRRHREIPLFRHDPWGWPRLCQKARARRASGHRRQ
jgi:hypothetical protein